MTTHVLKQVRIKPEHHATGKTRHTRHGVLVPVPSVLRIVQYDGDPGYYLLYIDGDGREMTDTYHETIDGAVEQATWEFGVRSEEWVPSGDGVQE